MGSSSLVTTMLPDLSFRKLLLPSVIGIGAPWGRPMPMVCTTIPLSLAFLAIPTASSSIFTIGDDDNGFAPFEVRGERFHRHFDGCAYGSTLNRHDISGNGFQKK